MNLAKSLRGILHEIQDDIIVTVNYKQTLQLKSNMKKKYIAPNMETITIELCSMLTASITVNIYKETVGAKESLSNERGDERQWGNIWND